jgi:putative tricarboxylic transport membrane protein
VDVRRFTLRHAEVLAGVAFVALAILVVWQGFDLGPGWDDSGPQPGFFPASLALLMGLGGVAALWAAVRSRDETPFLEVRQEAVDLIAVGIPAALAVASVPVLGLYIMTTVYIGAFAAWYGGLRWYFTVPGGLAGALVLYWALERSFHIPLPKSIWYGTWLPF